MQHVSKDPATRHDVINLQEQLDRRHLERQVRAGYVWGVRGNNSRFEVIQVLTHPLTTPTATTTTL